MSEENPVNREYAKRIARADELTDLAKQADNPGSKVAFLQLAAAFRHLAGLMAPKPPDRPDRQN